MTSRGTRAAGPLKGDRRSSITVVHEWCVNGIARFAATVRVYSYFLPERMTLVPEFAARV
jgi:hypothetical protein